MTENLDYWAKSWCRQKNFLDVKSVKSLPFMKLLMGDSGIQINFNTYEGMWMKLKETFKFKVVTLLHRFKDREERKVEITNSGTFKDKFKGKGKLCEKVRAKIFRMVSMKKFELLKLTSSDIIKEGTRMKEKLKNINHFMKSKSFFELGTRSILERGHEVMKKIEDATFQLNILPNSIEMFQLLKRLDQESEELMEILTEFCIIFDFTSKVRDFYGDFESEESEGEDNEVEAEQKKGKSEIEEVTTVEDEESENRSHLLGQHLHIFEDFQPFSHPDKRISAVVYDKLTQTLWTGGEDGLICCWEKSGRCVRVLSRHTSKVSSLVLADNNGMIISGGGDGLCLGWDTKTGEVKHLYVENSSPIACVATHLFCLFVAGQGCQIYKIHRENETVVSTFEGHEKGVVHLHVCYEVGEIFSSSLDGTIRIWNIETGICKRKISLSNPVGKTLGHLCVFNDRIFCKSGEDIVSIWSREQNGIYSVEEYNPVPFTLRYNSFCVHGKYLVGVNSKYLEVWDLANSDKIQKELEEHMCISSSSILVCGEDQLFCSDGSRIVRISLQVLRSGEVDEGSNVNRSFSNESVRATQDACHPGAPQCSILHQTVESGDDFPFDISDSFLIVHQNFETAEKIMELDQQIARKIIVGLHVHHDEKRKVVLETQGENFLKNSGELFFKENNVEYDSVIAHSENMENCSCDPSVKIIIFGNYKGKSLIEYKHIKKIVENKGDLVFILIPRWKICRLYFMVSLGKKLIKKKKAYKTYESYYGFHVLGGSEYDAPRITRKKRGKRQPQQRLERIGHANMCNQFGYGPQMLQMSQQPLYQHERQPQQQPQEFAHPHHHLHHVQFEWQHYPIWPHYPMYHQYPQYHTLFQPHQQFHPPHHLQQHPRKSQPTGFNVVGEQTTRNMEEASDNEHHNRHHQQQQHVLQEENERMAVEKIKKKSRKQVSQQQPKSPVKSSKRIDISKKSSKKRYRKKKEVFVAEDLETRFFSSINKDDDNVEKRNIEEPPTSKKMKSKKKSRRKVRKSSKQSPLPKKKKRDLRDDHDSYEDKGRRGSGWDEYKNNNNRDEYDDNRGKRRKDDDKDDFSPTYERYNRGDGKISSEKKQQQQKAEKRKKEKSAIKRRKEKPIVEVDHFKKHQKKIKGRKPQSCGDGGGGNFSVYNQTRGWGIQRQMESQNGNMKQIFSEEKGGGMMDPSSAVYTSSGWKYDKVSVGKNGKSSGLNPRKKKKKKPQHHQRPQQKKKKKKGGKMPNHSPSTSDENPFGLSQDLSRGFKDWFQRKMIQIGRDPRKAYTLMFFLMSLDNEKEITQSIYQTLGRNEVSELFAKEFLLQYRSFEVSKNRAAADNVPNKKKKKKKKEQQV